MFFGSSQQPQGNSVCAYIFNQLLISWPLYINKCSFFHSRDQKMFLTVRLLSITVLFFNSALIPSPALASSSTSATIPHEEVMDVPTVNDSRLKVEIVSERIDRPTSMAFLGPDDILVLEKDSGKVRRVLNGSILPQPLLDVPVATVVERGMLGIAVENKTQNGSRHPYVFIYFTLSKSSKDAVDNCSPTYPAYCEQKNEPLGNRLYRYELENNRLVNPKLLMDLPAAPGPDHNGGAVLIGPDGNVYTVVGDIRPQNDMNLGLMQPIVMTPKNLMEEVVYFGLRRTVTQ